MDTWYIRESPDQPLEEVISFTQAEYLARDRSRTNKTGVVETVVRVDSGLFFVDAIFIRGRKLFQGKRARDLNNFRLPPIG